MTPFDSTDVQLFGVLDIDPRRPAAKIAEELGLARGTVNSRLEKYRKGKVLRPSSVRIPPASLGLRARAFVTAAVTQNALERSIAALRSIPEVVECLAISGANDVLCQVVARDTDHLYEVGQRILRSPGIVRTSTAIVLNEYIDYRINQLL
ncbi:AsnC family transcriptional regulator [Arthrobacter sp. StoSoilA2]|uniref:Lrp/AsnC family transcriptional regulator n=1 Tax=Arthrobacter sp. StoSoilA2 TaxID=2830990 RepID=UPI001CC34568|nr:Lrp/AsnC family transcriptional regulator [Arthrobacter sp. StoSoilA2]BCW36023.1 AsnC family transcriptional regulator [Arthrobacter sp. StoSoilA2]